MLIVIVGPPQAGKNVLAQHLVNVHGFERVQVGSALGVATRVDALHFSSSSDFLEHATRTWRRNYVCTDLHSHQKLQEFCKRPFVAVVAVDAPIGVRYRRAVATAQALSTAPPSLEDFVTADDNVWHGALPASTATIGISQQANGRPSSPSPPTLLSPGSDSPPSPSPSPARTPTELTILDEIRDPLSLLQQLASTTLFNPFSTVEPFFESLSLAAVSATLRPPWDIYFMRLADLASLRSNCMKRRVGAVLVRDHRVVSTGYNGTPRGVKNCGEGGCGRCNSNGDGLTLERDARLKGMGEGLDECLCLHAEENALLEAGRARLSGGGTEGAVLYCNTCPCLRCTVKIVQCGITEVVYSLSYSMDAASRRVMEEAGIILRQLNSPPPLK
ncbi:Deoxycytidine monophosphate (dCMP) deaminase [Microbotryomycetes sp. JL201]|nr:Deoxycytidine monophosphate (dCMP) deaminase [Microbotryomycetes sp. JL201]